MADNKIQDKHSSKATAGKVVLKSKQIPSAQTTLPHSMSWRCRGDSRNKSSYLHDISTVAYTGRPLQIRGWEG